MEKEIFKIISDENNIEIMAKEIVDVFVNESNDKNIDYSFTVNQTTGQIKNKEANTYFWFDPKQNTFLYKFKTALFSEDLKDIQENSVEEKDLIERVREFIIKVCKNITENHRDEIRETVKRVVLGNKPNSSNVPLKTIEVITIDIADYSSISEEAKYLLEIGKLPDTEIDTDKITSFVQNKKGQTDLDYSEIVTFEKQIGNPLFKNVVSIKQGSRYLNEYSIYFFVDYSLEMKK